MDVLQQCANGGPLHVQSVSALALLACQHLSTTTTTTTTATNKTGTPDTPADPQPPGLDPEKRRYILQLIQAIYDARSIAACYNVVILAVILVLAWVHWTATRRDRRRWRLRTQSGKQRAVVPTTTTASSSFSSSSSTSSSRIRNEGGGNTPPPGLAKDTISMDPSVVDLERLPLLTTKTTGQRRRRTDRDWRSWGLVCRRRVSSFLTRQPTPIPIVNKTLPSNGTSLFILAWLVLNISIHLLGLTYQWNFFFVFADKAGLMFVVNLPLLYLLAAKNQPLRRLTGYSYEALNIFHRRVGEYMCFLALVHFASMVLWQFVIAEDWLRRLASPSASAYFMHPVILEGIGAFLSYELLYFTSLGSFRQRWYEMFLASHVVLQIVALGFLWLHFHTSRPYVAISLGIFLVDRLVWRLTLKRADMVADVVVLEDGRTLLLSADWDIPSDPPNSRRMWMPVFLRWKSVAHGWRPTNHVFLTVPVLGRSHSLQAHPFTIASAAPPSTAVSDAGGPGRGARHAWLSLLIRAQDGFTQELLHHAETYSRVSVRLDGPYGSSHALDMLRASDCAILVAGGSGIAVTFPLVWALLNDNDQQEEEEDEQEEEDKLVSAGARILSDTRKKQSIHMIWLTHSRSHKSWIPQDRLDEMVQMGLDLVMPEPTEDAGRPDVAGFVEGWIQGLGDGDSTTTTTERSRSFGVVCSGPDGLNRLVRNVCADAMVGYMDEGVDVRVAVEKFGW